MGCYTQKSIQNLGTWTRSSEDAKNYTNDKDGVGIQKRVTEYRVNNGKRQRTEHQSLDPKPSTLHPHCARRRRRVITDNQIAFESESVVSVLVGSQQPTTPEWSNTMQDTPEAHILWMEEILHHPTYPTVQPGKCNMLGVRNIAKCPPSTGRTQLAQN